MRLGGKKLADYDGERNRFYEASGFVAESRADFDPKQAPKGWDYEKQGKPDILFWRYAGEEAAQAAKPTDVESLWKSNYEAAEEWRDTEIRKAEEENANKTVEEEKQPVNEHMVDKNGIMKEETNENVQSEKRLVPATEEIRQVLEDAGLNQEKIDEVIALPKGQKPAPNSYLAQNYIDKHLRQFTEGGIVKIISTEPKGTVGHKGGIFVLSEVELTKIIKEADGDIAKIEKALGFDQGSLGTDPVVVKFLSPTGLRMPDGNELGANRDYWIPGGFTSGGIKEAVIDMAPEGTYTFYHIFD